MDNSTARKKEVQMSGKLANFRSWVFSIIKIKYGWNGCVPDGCDPEQWETLIEKGHDNTVFSDEIAHEIVDDIYLHGGTFRQRLDGKPNTLVPTQSLTAPLKHCKHGVILYGTRCIKCARERVQ